MRKVQLRGKCAPSYIANLYCVCICEFVRLCICKVVYLCICVFVYLEIVRLFIRKVQLRGKCAPPSHILLCLYLCFVFVFVYLCFVFVFCICVVHQKGPTERQVPASLQCRSLLAVSKPLSLSTPGSDFVGCTLIRVLLYRPYPTFPTP